MKLAEALILRANHSARIEELKKALAANAKVQEGDQLPFNAQELLQEIEVLAAEQQSLIQRINRTNATTSFDETMTISDAIAKRDILKLRKSIYHSLLDALSSRLSRLTRSEVKYVATLNAGELRNTSDEIAKQYRELDTQLQGLNWTTDLIED